MENEERYQILLLKSIEQDLTVEEQNELESFAYYKIDQDILNQVSSYQLPKWDNEEKYKELIHLRSQPKKEAKVVSLKQRYWVSGIAASILVIVFCFFFFKTSSSENHLISYSTPSEGTFDVSLPCKSVVKLNAQSKISFDTVAWDNKRDIVLEGEAFFDVEKGKTFTVKLGKGEVTVHGTSFNINNRGEFVRVNCYTGKVVVKQNTDSVVLTKGQGAYFDANQKIESYTNLREQPNWLNTDSKFDKASLAEVFNDIELEFKVSVEASEVDVARKYTGTYSHQNIEEAAKNIAIPMGLKYEIKGKTITFTNK